MPPLPSPKASKKRSDTWLRYFHGQPASHERQKDQILAMYSLDVQPAAAGGRVATSGLENTVRLWKIPVLPARTDAAPRLVFIST